jgi:hypothetical protein
MARKEHLGCDSLPGASIEMWLIDMHFKSLLYDIFIGGMAHGTAVVHSFMS